MLIFAPFHDGATLQSAPEDLDMYDAVSRAVADAFDAFCDGAADNMSLFSLFSFGSCDALSPTATTTTTSLSDDEDDDTSECDSEISRLEDDSDGVWDADDELTLLATVDELILRTKEEEEEAMATMEDDGVCDSAVELLALSATATSLIHSDDEDFAIMEDGNLCDEVDDLIRLTHEMLGNYEDEDDEEGSDMTIEDTTGENDEVDDLIRRTKAILGSIGDTKIADDEQQLIAPSAAAAAMSDFKDAIAIVEDDGVDDHVDERIAPPSTRLQCAAATAMDGFLSIGEFAMRSIEWIMKESAAAIHTMCACVGFKPRKEEEELDESSAVDGTVVLHEEKEEEHDDNEVDHQMPESDDE